MRVLSCVSAVLVLAATVVPSTTALYSSSDDVVQLSAKEFNKKVIKGDELWMVEFYAPWCGHCKSLAPEWKKAASALKGAVKIAAVDATADESLGSKYGIRGFPTIKVFGANKRSPTDYQGPRQADGIIKAAMKELNSMVKSRQSGGGKRKTSSSSSSSSSSGGSKKKRSRSKVVTVTDDTFEDEVLGTDEVVMVEFFAPWCGHCKALAPEWEDAASQLDGQVKLVAVDATENSAFASQFGVRGYPTIKVFPGGPKTVKSAKDYQGPREAAGIVSFALKELEASGVEPDIPELTSQDVFDEHCSGKRICVIAILADILDDGGKDGRLARLEMLKEVAKKQRGTLLRFLWTSAGKQPAIESDLGPFDPPAVVAINVNKKVYGVHRGSMSTSSLGAFATKLAGGRGGTAKVSAIPAIATVTPWDGEEGKVEFEEEFSLDDIMGEDL